MRSLFIATMLFLSAALNAQTSFTYNWSNGLGCGGGDDKMKASAMATFGVLYVGGRIDGVVDFDPGVGNTSFTETAKGYIASYTTSTGALNWAGVLTGTGTSEVACMGLDAASNIYVAGYFQSGGIDFDMNGGISVLTPTMNDMFIAKYSPAGNFIWAKQVGGLSTTVDPGMMKVTPSGDIYIVGNFNMNCDFDPGIGVQTLTTSGGTDIFLAKYDNAGNYIWAFRVGDTGTDFGLGLDVDASGNVVITGQFEYGPDFDPGAGTTTLTSAGAEDIYIAKYTNSGIFVWADAMGGSGTDVGMRVKFDNLGNVVGTGVFASSNFDADPSPTPLILTKIGMAGMDEFVGKYNGSTGGYGWARNTGAAVSPGDVYAFGLEIDAQNNIYVAGSFADIVDFNYGVGTATLQAQTTLYNDIFISRYDANSNFTYAYNMGGGFLTGNEAHNIHLLGNQVFLTGEYTNTVDIDPGPGTQTLTSYGGIDFFMAKYTQCIWPTIPSIAQTTNQVCAGGNASLSVTSGSLNDAPNWSWYTGSCGGTLAGTGTVLAVNPTLTTTYYLKGDGGCVPGGGTCVNSTIIALPSTNLAGQVTTPSTIAPVPVSGSVTLYRYESQFTKFDSITTLQLDVNGNFTVTSAPSNSYILMAIPSATNLLITYAPSANAWKGATPFFHGCSGLTSQNISVIPLINFGTGPGILTGKVVEGLKYGQRSSQVTAPGNPIRGLTVKGGRNPGGNVGAQDKTASDGTYTLSGLPYNTGGESYYVLVDIPGLDTASTYHKVIVTGSEIFTTLDFVVDSAKVVPQVFVGVKENKMENASYKIYPNPTTGKLFIQFMQNDPGKISVSLTDIAGKVVSEILPEVFENSKEVTIISDQSALEAGLYFLRLKAGENNETIKIIIQH